MILDRARFIGQQRAPSACKMLIDNGAPVAQGIERSPPKPNADRWQVTARAKNPTPPSSNKSPVSRAKRRIAARVSIRILDSF